MCVKSDTREKREFLQNLASKFLNGESHILFLPMIQSEVGDTQKEPQTWIQASNKTFRGRKSSLRPHTHPSEERESSSVIATGFGERPGKVEATALTLILTATVSLVHIYPACSHVRQSCNEISHFGHFWTLTLRLRVLSELIYYRYTWFRLNQTHEVQDL